MQVIAALSRRYWDGATDRLWPEAANPVFCKPKFIG